MQRHSLRFAVSGIYSYDIDPTTVPVSNPFADRLREELAGLEFESAVHLIVFHPIVVRPDLGVYEDRTQYRPKESAVAISVVIPHSEWEGATQSDRVTLYARALRQGVERIKDAKLSPADKGTLLAAVERVYQEMAGRLASG